MSKITEIIGCFVITPCCTKCDWFSQPFFRVLNKTLPPIPRKVCPDCGSPISNMVGQYKIKQTKGFWDNTNEYIGFIRKESENN